MRTDARQPPVAAGSAAATAAIELANAADAQAGVRTRPATGLEVDRVLALFEATWGAGRGPDRSMLQAIAHAGNTMLLAVPAPETLASPAPRPAEGAILGATLGFLGWEGGVHLHSHMNAVDPVARGRGIGLALKLRQRAICLEHGIDEIRWTYDPLIRRNARMNLVRLGAEVAAFRPDFYGRLDDAITGADRSDRFEVRWRLASARTARALDRRPQPAWSVRGGFALVADFEALRADAPADAARLRERSHEAFAALAGSGLRPELDAAGDYVFTNDDPDREAE
ncbi:hypothetical protein [Agromyces cerinus]|uniref:Predicted acetyltransferase, GNAT superfamily n=1 Tax=Agromyces cerinus subsp. cerinus TaxID=232089 RepID=A0A1N6DD63_9MICO|nr:hypothetical protein [Agromyces cerinus]SIN68748.1 Predicted acetyltransferase, GNAT superfamily [Agromyces cerinus subsp. cerinus]